MSNPMFALVFPGQGSQTPGMMQGVAELAGVRETFDEATEVLGQDLWQMVEQGSQDTLNLTVNTQPVMLAAGVATWRAWRAMGGPLPAMMAGHSLGEYTALVAAGALEFADALRLVRLRAQLMQDAVPEGTGAMAAILGMDDDAVRGVCRDAAEDLVLEAVNYNADGQVVIAGNRLAVERAMLLAKERGAKRAVLLPVSVPSHCALMQPAARVLADELEKVGIAVPIVPVLHNADVAVYGDAAAIRDALSRQLYSPVRWVETVRAMGDAGIRLAGECGPGKVLAGLARRIDERVPTQALISSDALRAFADNVNELLAA
ncbi:MAG: ACP S-malonyltransferase [Betaproteobacteria bacterium]|nr:ACP S-malonyltransferase [Betaproteobacteria bacterium]